MMPMGEIYNALETGVVDGQEVPYPLVVAAGFWEEQKYCLETHHMFSYNSVIVNKKSYDALTPEVREAFDACMKEAIDYNWEISREDDDQSRQFLIDKGLEVTVPSPEFRQQMKDAMVPFFDWYFGEFPELKSVYKAMADTK
jgi:TRAP-type C4-dicarboxylate transport system substrate-binding protein